MNIARNAALTAGLLVALSCAALPAHAATPGGLPKARAAAEATTASTPMLTSHKPGVSAPSGDVTFRGTAEPGSFVVLTIGGNSAGAIAASNGTWSAALNSIGPGKLVLTLQDRFSIATKSYTLTFSAQAAKPVLTSHVAGKTYKAGPTVFSGTATPGSRVDVTIIKGQPIQIFVPASGKWSTPPMGAKQGTVTVTLTAGRNNYTTPAVKVSLKFGAPAPVTPTITSVAPGGSLLMNGKIVFYGRGAAGAKLLLKVGSLELPVTVGDDGIWDTKSLKYTAGTKTVTLYTLKGSTRTSVTSIKVKFVNDPVKFNAQQRPAVRSTTGAV